MDKAVREPKQKRSIEKKERIISAANNLFIEKGYFNITTAEIAKTAGLSTGTVYAYFKDKKNILLECLYKNGQEYIGQIVDELGNFSENKDLFNTIKNILNIFIQLHTTYPKKYHDELMSLVYTDNDVMKYFQRIKNIMMDAVVAQLKKSGIELKHEKEQSFLMYSLIENIEDELVFDINPDLNKEVLIDECARVIVAMIQVL
ncbi:MULTISPECIES: TetR/AcrR family transcriptional regulator [Clostridium]|uniref:TetR/AcrR family transcriptional regulator n=1 Tax=Clostridium TaxID=1485 RepID=UPI00069F69FC|nr:MULTISPECIES: TetR/AcrR family transcriptional regulator [Clostridium]KOF55660.1 AcrR family transcriptional regulator [Clostridium sp. DMHC 10]MCD2349076.1 TetR/AcrR family transcriptional regulator [Clostridium guangxiense]